MIRRLWNWFRGIVRSVALAFSVKKPRRRVVSEYVTVHVTSADAEWLSRDFSRAMDSVDIAMSQVGRALDEVGDSLRNRPIGTPTEVRPLRPKKDDDFNIN